MFKPFTTMHIQCLALPPCLLFKSYVFQLPAWWAYSVSCDHLQNAAMLQCASQYLQSISVTVSLLHSVGNKTYNYCYCHCYYCYYVYDRGCWHMYIDTTPGSVLSRASSSSCLLAERQTLPYLTGFELVCNFAHICAVQIVVDANATW